MAALIALILLGIAGRLIHHGETPAAARAGATAGCRVVGRAFYGRQNGVWLTVAARVSRLLPDEDGASIHQRFILRCLSGQTVLIENNVEVGRRVPVKVGEAVVVHGQYIWNKLGGLVHDTHLSTDGNPDGWIYAAGRVFQ